MKNASLLNLLRAFYQWFSDSWISMLVAFVIAGLAVSLIGYLFRFRVVLFLWLVAKGIFLWIFQLL